MFSKWRHSGSLALVMILSVSVSALAAEPPQGDLNTMITSLKNWVISGGSAILIGGGVVGLVMCVKSLVQLYYVAETETDSFQMLKNSSGGGLQTLFSLFVGVAMSILGIIVGWASLAWVTA